MEQKVSVKNILVLDRQDHTEAMRVAAGLTIVGHEVRLVFMNKPVAETEENAEQAELLELCDIEPQTTVAAMEEDLEFLNAKALAEAIKSSDHVVSI